VRALSYEIACLLDYDCGWACTVERVPGSNCLSIGRNVGIRRLRIIRQEIWVPPRHETDRAPPKLASNKERPGFEKLFHVERNA
jgi:hypothetical protein